ncbi:MAG: DegT/DnrJ/EryC1/StrS family aminotransferase, partial [Bacteriovoracaceae bacterium]|nr:DegT/DnrJ/EryC1/StrS family aminotransferase [Bacteriovoracaceae bacterium]
MSRQVPFYDFQKLHNPEFQTKIKERFSEIIDQNGFVEGRFNHSFEERFAKLQKAKHCLLVANGTDALEISLLAYGLEPGDRVAVAGITFYASGEAVLNMGMIPVYVDVDPKSGLMCPESLERVVDKYEIKAVMPVHIYGLPADMKAIDEICHSRNIPVIEDAAQAQGGYTYTGPVGSGKNLVTFSFYPTKNLAAFGDAGAILTDDDELAEIIKTIRNHGRSSLEMMGRNSRCDHLQAAVLDLKLDSIEEQNQSRKKIASMYHQALKDLPLACVDDSY